MGQCRVSPITPSRALDQYWWMSGANRQSVKFPHLVHLMLGKRPDPKIFQFNDPAWHKATKCLK